MNCEETRRYWHLYHDSEGAAELHHEINEHLGNCPDCAEWFHHQSRLEDLLVEKLRMTEELESTPHLWEKVLAGSGVESTENPRRWWLLSSILVLTVTAVIAILVWFPKSDSKTPELAVLTAKCHHEFHTGDRSVEFASESDLEVEQYLRSRVQFPVRCPPRQDTGFLVEGAGICKVNGSDAAYLRGQLDGAAISIFILSKQSLRRFPVDRQLIGGGGTYRQQDGRLSLAMAAIDQSVVLVMGQTDPTRLERVLRAYGTYPDPHHG